MLDFLTIDICGAPRGEACCKSIDFANNALTGNNSSSFVNIRPDEQVADSPITSPGTGIGPTGYALIGSPDDQALAVPSYFAPIFGTGPFGNSVYCFRCPSFVGYEKFHFEAYLSSAVFQIFSQAQIWKASTSEWITMGDFATSVGMFELFSFSYTPSANGSTVDDFVESDGCIYFQLFGATESNDLLIDYVRLELCPCADGAVGISSTGPTGAPAPAFSANIAAARNIVNQSVGPGTNVQLTLPVEILDQAGAYDGTSIYTVPSSGVYEIVAMIPFRNNATPAIGIDVSITLFINGAPSIVVSTHKDVNFEALGTVTLNLYYLATFTASNTIQLRYTNASGHALLILETQAIISFKRLSL